MIYLKFQCIDHKKAKTIRVAAQRNQESRQREELQKEAVPLSRCQLPLIFWSNNLSKVEELRKLALEASSTEELEARHRSEIEARDLAATSHRMVIIVYTVRTHIDDYIILYNII